MSPIRADAPAAVPRRRLFASRRLWVIGIALYIGAIWYLGWRHVCAALLDVRLPFLACLIALETANMWFRAAKWRLALGPGKQSVALYFVSKAAGNLSPGRVGELAPLLLRDHRSPRLAAWIVLDRLIEAGATIVLGVFGLAMLRIPHGGTILAVSLLFLVLFVALPLLLLAQHRFLSFFASRFKQGTPLHTVASFLAETSSESLLFRRRMPLMVCMTLLATASDVVVGIFLFLAQGYSVGFMALAAVQCAHGIVSAIPLTPNATGLPYLVALDIVHELAGVPWNVLLVSVALRTACANAVFWSSFGIGASGFRKNEDRGVEEIRP